MKLLRYNANPLEISIENIDRVVAGKYTISVYTKDHNAYVGYALE